MIRCACKAGYTGDGKTRCTRGPGRGSSAGGRGGPAAATDRDCSKLAKDLEVAQANAQLARGGGKGGGAGASTAATSGGGGGDDPEGAGKEDGAGTALVVVAAAAAVVACVALGVAVVAAARANGRQHATSARQPGSSYPLGNQADMPNPTYANPAYPAGGVFVEQQGQSAI